MITGQTYYPISLSGLRELLSKKFGYDATSLEGICDIIISHLHVRTKRLCYIQERKHAMCMMIECIGKPSISIARDCPSLKILKLIPVMIKTFLPCHGETKDYVLRIISGVLRYNEYVSQDDLEKCYGFVKKIISIYHLRISEQCDYIDKLEDAIWNRESIDKGKRY